MSHLFVYKYLYVIGSSCPGGDIKHTFIQPKGKCVDRKQIEDQLKANKSIVYHFDENSSQKNRKKIKRCNPGSDPGYDFKEGMKDLKQEMTKMKRELIMAIHAQKSKNCGPYQNGNVGQ